MFLSSNLITLPRFRIAFNLRRLPSSLNQNQSTKWKKSWIPNILASVYSISSNGNAVTLLTIPGNPRHSLKMHPISSKHSIRNIHVVLNPRSLCNVCQFLSSVVFCVSSVFYIAILLFISSETSVSMRGGIVRTQHRLAFHYLHLEISLKYLHRIYSIVW